MFSSEHPDVAFSLLHIGKIQRELGQHKKAISTLERALATYKSTLGAKHPNVARTLTAMGDAYGAIGEYALYLHYNKKASAIVTRRSNIDRESIRGTSGDADPYGTYINLIQAAYFNVKKRPKRRQKLLKQALNATQRAQQTAAGAALAKMSARKSSADAALVSNMRRQQDLVEEWRRLDKEIVAVVSDSPGNREPSALESLHAKRKQAEKGIVALTKKLRTEFPEYAALAAPEPLPLPDVQKLLKPDEAMIVYLVGNTAMFVWAITADRVALERIDMTSASISKNVAELRTALDPIMRVRSVRGFTREAVCRNLSRVEGEKHCAAYDFSLKMAFKTLQTTRGSCGTDHSGEEKPACRTNRRAHKPALSASRNSETACRNEHPISFQTDGVADTPPCDIGSSDGAEFGRTSPQCQEERRAVRIRGDWGSGVSQTRSTRSGGAT